MAQSEEYGVDLQKVSFVINSQYRQETLEVLDRPLTPTMISEQSGQSVAHVSRALGELTDKGLAELVVDENTKKGRLFHLTTEGSDVAEFIEENY